ncbi:hypothetical protein [Kutzneria buriramensis]|uniref:Uncharacterized protein n=1 Tax=Kutzneria buriramensis TaxID=1045776 RepID=A0A3E0I8W7_9PSEU|nr:hypothetical protein [Kutzneria buriramensis]REH55110.1 hypothetical protein BCF44_101126 [Kutzneria buriramensis]
MSPVSRNRKPKRKGQRPRPQSPIEAAVVASNDLLGMKALYEAQLWAAGLIGGLWRSAWQRDGDPDETMDRTVERLVEALVEKGSPATLAALLALGSVGYDEERDFFLEAATELTAAGVSAPDWYRQEQPPLEDAWSVADAFGDIELITLGYPDIVIGVLVDHATSLHIVQIAVVERSQTDAQALARELGVNVDPSPKPVRLTATEALERIDGPLGLFLVDGPEAHAEMLQLPDDSNPAMEFTLLQARADALTDELPEIEDFEPAIEDFLASRTFKDVELARAWAVLAAGSASSNGRRVRQIGPASLDYLLSVGVPANIEISDEDLALLPEIVTAWVHHHASAEQRPVWDERLAEILERFTEAYHDPELVEFRAESDELVALRDIEDVLEDFDDLPPVPEEAADTAHVLKVAIGDQERQVEIESVADLDELSAVIQEAFGLEPDPAWDFEIPSGGMFGPESEVAVAQVGFEGLHFDYAVGALDTVEAHIDVLRVEPKTGKYPRFS